MNCAYGRGTFDPIRGDAVLHLCDLLRDVFAEELHRAGYLDGSRLLLIDYNALGSLITE